MASCMKIAFLASLYSPFLTRTGKETCLLHCYLLSVFHLPLTCTLMDGGQTTFIPDFHKRAHVQILFPSHFSEHPSWHCRTAISSCRLEHTGCSSSCLSRSFGVIHMTMHSLIRNLPGCTPNCKTFILEDLRVSFSGCNQNGRTQN